MKDISRVIGIGSTIIFIVGFFTFVGYRINKLALFIVLGFIIAIMYLFKEVFKR